MGITSNELICTICGFNTNYCHGHFGHLDYRTSISYGLFYHVIDIKMYKANVQTTWHKNEEEIIEILKNKTGRHRLNEIKAKLNISYCQNHYGCGAPYQK